MNRFTHRTIRTVLPLFVLLAGATANAQTDCINDDDCPGAECGGEVCQWLTEGIQCMPAGSMPEGQDGWCTDDSDCKCGDQGATCVAAHCTFVTPRSGSGGATGSGGGSTTGGAAGSGAAGSGTAGSGDSGSDDGGGCSVAGPGSRGGHSVAWLGLGLGLVAGARRRRAR